MSIILFLIIYEIFLLSLILVWLDSQAFYTYACYVFRWAYVENAEQMEGSLTHPCRQELCDVDGPDSFVVHRGVVFSEVVGQVFFSGSPFDMKVILVLAI